MRLFTKSFRSFLVHRRRLGKFSIRHWISPTLFLSSVSRHYVHYWVIVTSGAATTISHHSCCALGFLSVSCRRHFSGCAICRARLCRIRFISRLWRLRLRFAVRAWQKNSSATADNTPSNKGTNIWRWMSPVIICRHERFTRSLDSCIRSIVRSPVKFLAFRVLTI